MTLLRNNISDWSRYPFCVPAIRSLDTLELANRVTFFVGENGSGKSTLLEAIALACGFGREGGTRNFTFSTQNEARDEINSAEGSIDALTDALRLSWGQRQRDGFFLRAESFYNVASYLDRLAKADEHALLSYGETSLHARSHGESFLALLLERFTGNGLYLIDEPEAALSATRQLALLTRMHVLLEEYAQTQFIIATHSPIVLAYPGAQIYSFDRSAVRIIPYGQTDAYLITRRFLHDPARAVRELLAEHLDVP